MGKYIEHEMLFKIALKYIEKGYSYEQLSWGDDLYKSPEEEKDICLGYYETIQEQGTNWAYEQLNLEHD